MKNVGYYNGEVGLIEEMMVPMNDRAMYFGDGVYDATYAANRKIFEADAHIERFFNSFKALEMPFQIEFAKPLESLKHRERRKLEPPSFKEKNLEIRVVLGPQEDYFTEEGINTFFSSSYKIMPESDRMGYRLDGEAIAYKEKVDIISDAIVPGAIQVPSGGKPIILMADRQTTGGYAKIGSVISVDLPLLAQAAPGSTLQFVQVSVEEAQELLIAEKMKYKRLRRRINGWR